MDAAQELNSEQPQTETSQNTDLNYAAPVKQTLYTPVKVSLWTKISSPFSKTFGPVFRIMRAFLPEVIIFIVFCLVMVYALNYFNFLPLSSTYPKLFGILPHRYDITANKAALAGVEYSPDIEGYQIEGKLYKVSNDRISIEYKGKVVEFLISGELSCSKRITTQISAGVEKTTDELAFCSDILKNENVGKKAFVVFNRNGDINYIKLITLE